MVNCEFRSGEQLAHQCEKKGRQLNSGPSSLAKTKVIQDHPKSKCVIYSNTFIKLQNTDHVLYYTTSVYIHRDKKQNEKIHESKNKDGKRKKKNRERTIRFWKKTGKEQ